MSTKTGEPQELVQVSGRGTQVNFKIDDSVPLATARRALREHLEQSRQLYAKGEVAVDVGNRILWEDEQDAIREVIGSHSGLKIKRLWCAPSILERELERITNLLAVVNPPAIGFADEPHASGEKGLDSSEPEPADDGNPFAQQVFVGGLTPGGERYGAPGLIVRGTCRAGEVIDVAGNLVILGNVNPGAQVTAGGDILVFGELRGQAHAGASGDATATIIAMSTAHPSLRIAGYAWRDDESPPNFGHRGPDRNVAVIARVRNGSVHLAPYRKNYALDHGGNPHER